MLRAYNLTTFMCRLSYNLGASPYSVQACAGIGFNFTIILTLHEGARIVSVHYPYVSQGSLRDHVRMSRLLSS